jgi:hypothetical protein
MVISTTNQNKLANSAVTLLYISYPLDTSLVNSDEICTPKPLHSDSKLTKYTAVGGLVLACLPLDPRFAGSNPDF